MKHVGIFLANGFEEIEGLTVVDLLRRAEVDTTLISVTGKLDITGGHGISVKADVLFEEQDFSAMDMVVLPGGMPGTTNLKKHKGLIKLLEEQNSNHKYIAAICAAPGILGELGFLDNRKACSYPSVEEQLTGAIVLHQPVVSDEHIITSRGLGTAIPFSLEIISTLCGQEKSNQIAQSIIFE
jgi:4-methyl-5(b-hydroxyethyl)-thiazole monophosphate biosynthesis